MNVHFIAIGGSAMHNLAMALQDLGHKVSGSDDQVFEPSRSRLEKRGLLPDEMGWHPEKITDELDAVILGMHAKKDNPELLKAQEIGLKIFSYPEFLYLQSRHKKRVVIGGSHGKTSITSMILHVLREQGIDVDYMVGAQLKGFDTMVKLSKSAEYMVMEGDEYLSSPIDRRPKFHLYKPHIGLISGIAWDHINVFPTFDNYVDQFRIFINHFEPNGTLIYCDDDIEVHKLAFETNYVHRKIPYSIPEHEIVNGVSELIFEGKRYPLEVFGDHNLQNINGAWMVLREMGLQDEQILNSFKSFAGAAKRLELIKRTEKSSVFKDFAHSPSKLKATTKAVKKQFTDRKLVACMELHTFSSLNQEFLSHYAGSMDEADLAIVYFNPDTIKHKGLPEISVDLVKEGFANPNVEVYTDSEKLLQDLRSENWDNKNLLLMTSGNFNGVNLDEFGKDLI